MIKLLKLALGAVGAATVAAGLDVNTQYKIVNQLIDLLDLLQYVQ